MDKILEGFEKKGNVNDKAVEEKEIKEKKEKKLKTKKKVQVGGRRKGKIQ